MYQYAAPVASYSLWALKVCVLFYCIAQLQNKDWRETPHICPRPAGHNNPTEDGSLHCMGWGRLRTLLSHEFTWMSSYLANVQKASLAFGCEKARAAKTRSWLKAAAVIDLADFITVNTYKSRPLRRPTHRDAWFGKCKQPWLWKTHSCQPLHIRKHGQNVSEAAYPSQSPNSSATSFLPSHSICSFTQVVYKPKSFQVIFKTLQKFNDSKKKYNNFFSKCTIRCQNITYKPRNWFFCTDTTCKRHKQGAETYSKGIHSSTP